MCDSAFPVKIEQEILPFFSIFNTLEAIGKFNLVEILEDNSLNVFELGDKIVLIPLFVITSSIAE